MTEDKKYKVIKKLVEINGNKQRAAVELNCSLRHINRMIVGYKKYGKDFFSHGNKGRKPSHTMSDGDKSMILDLYRNKYYDANLQHFSELLGKYENITVSPSTVRSILLKEHILSPRAKRLTKKMLKKKLQAIKEQASSKKEIDKIVENIMNIEDSHPRRPRCAYFGEMLQMDASLHHWFGVEKTHLHIALDDCTGSIVGAYFDTQETLKGYYAVLNQVLTNHGIPYMFFTDRRTVFEYKKKDSSSTENDTFTQFSYACNQLGIQIKTSSIPQAKGRVERMFQTLQSRLPLEMRLAGATTLEQANEFLNHYIKEFNAMFALHPNTSKSVFEMQPDSEKINITLAVISERKVDAGHAIRYNKKYFKFVDSNGRPVYYRAGTKCLVIRALDGQLFSTVDEKVYSLEEIPAHEQKSKNFDFVDKETKTKQCYIPPMSHPWKRESFERFLKKQAHRQQISA